MRTHITRTHAPARTRPSGARALILSFCLASPPAKTRRVEGKDGGGEKEKTSCFFPGPPVWRRQQVCITTKEWKSWKSVSRQVLEWHLNSKHSRDHPRCIFCVCKHKLPPKSKWGKQRDSLEPASFDLLNVSPNSELKSAPFLLNWPHTHRTHTLPGAV